MSCSENLIRVINKKQGSINLKDHDYKYTN